MNIAKYLLACFVGLSVVTSAFAARDTVKANDHVIHLYKPAENMPTQLLNLPDGGALEEFVKTLGPNEVMLLRPFFASDHYLVATRDGFWNVNLRDSRGLLERARAMLKNLPAPPLRIHNPHPGGGAALENYVQNESSWFAISLKHRWAAPLVWALVPFKTAYTLLVRGAPVDRVPILTLTPEAFVQLMEALNTQHRHGHFHEAPDELRVDEAPSVRYVRVKRSNRYERIDDTVGLAAGLLIDAVAALLVLQLGR